MFPLKKKILIRGCAAHKASGLGCGADYRTIGLWLGDSWSYTRKKLYAPFSGKAWAWDEAKGGKWITLQRTNGDLIQMAHLSRRIVGSEHKSVKQGQLIGYTGNTGTLTTGPHLHLQIKRNGVRLDPEKYNWN